MSASASSAPSGQISGEGTAKKTKEGKEVALKIFENFLKKYEYPSWEHLSAAEFCNDEMLYKFSYYIVFVYMTSSDEPLMMRTTTQYLGRVMNVARRRFGEQRPLFFRVLDEDAPSDNWYKRMLKNVERNVGRRAIERGDPITKSAPQLSREVFANIALSYFAIGTLEALIRRLIVALLFLVGGRAGETAVTTWNLTSWDDILQILHFDWSQPKTGKQKGIGIISDKEYHQLDFYKALGDLFIFKYYRYDSRWHYCIFSSTFTIILQYLSYVYTNI
jgi:hypothetical protein